MELILFLALYSVVVLSVLVLQSSRGRESKKAIIGERKHKIRHYQSPSTRLLTQLASIITYEVSDVIPLAIMLCTIMESLRHAKLARDFAANHNERIIAR